MAAKGRRVFVATESFTALVDGVPQTFRKGVTRVREGHELIERYSQWFAPQGDHVDYEVEQATAAPGEKRGGTRAGA